MDLPTQLGHAAPADSERSGAAGPTQSLETALTQKMAESRRDDPRAYRPGFDVASRIIATDRGKRLMDEIRQLTATMVQEEDRLYAARAAREEGESRAALRANVGGLGVALLLVGIAMALLHWATREREREQSARATAEAVATVAATSEAWFRTTLASIGDAVIATDETGACDDESGRREPDGVDRGRGAGPPARYGVPDRQRDHAAPGREPR